MSTITGSVDQWIVRLKSVKRANTSAGRAPHKWVLLLAVLRRMEALVRVDEVVELDMWLEQEFRQVWDEHVQCEGFVADLAKPFYHLQSDGFWRLVAREGCEAWVGGLKAAPSLVALRQHVVGARLDGELVQVLRATEGFMRVKQAVAEWLRSGYRTTGFREPGDDAIGSIASTVLPSWCTSLDMK